MGRVSDKAGYQPTTLSKLLNEQAVTPSHYDAPPQSICASDIVRWNEWGESQYGASEYADSNVMRGWRYAGTWTSFLMAIPEFDHFGQCESISNYVCDIQDVAGLAHAKTDLSQFTNLDEFIEKSYPQLVDDVSESNLLRNLSHREIRIGHELRPEPSDHFKRYQWDNRLLLVNDGGAHHFAAARYIAKKIGRKVPLNGRLNTYCINRHSVESLRRQFNILVINGDTSIQNRFADAMESFRATYLWRRLPFQQNTNRAIFLPKTETRSNIVATRLLAANAFDLGAYLETLTRN